LQDIRYAWRAMCKEPVFAVTAVLSLALAIGASTAIYSIIDAAMLRPLPVSEPGRLFTLASSGISDPGSAPAPERTSFSYPQYLQFVAVAKPVARLALFSSAYWAEAKTRTDAPIERINRSYTSGEAFDILGVRPAAGRLFSREEDRMGSRAVAVLS